MLSTTTSDLMVRLGTGENTLHFSKFISESRDTKSTLLGGIVHVSSPVGDHFGRIHIQWELPEMVRPVTGRKPFDTPYTKTNELSLKNYRHITVNGHSVDTIRKYRPNRVSEQKWGEYTCHNTVEKHPGFNLYEIRDGKMWIATRMDDNCCIDEWVGCEEIFLLYMNTNLTPQGSAQLSESERPTSPGRGSPNAMSPLERAVRRLRYMKITAPH